jgi:hypothetical protein
LAPSLPSRHAEEHDGGRIAERNHLLDGRAGDMWERRNQQLGDHPLVACSAAAAASTFAAVWVRRTHATRIILFSQDVQRTFSNRNRDRNPDLDINLSRSGLPRAAHRGNVSCLQAQRAAW